MANIEYTVSSSFLPILVTLRQDNVNGIIVDSKVLQNNVVNDTFSGVTVGTYAVVAYDSAYGSDSSSGITYSTTTIAPIVKFIGAFNNQHSLVNSIIEDSSTGNYLVGGNFTGYTDSVSLTETNGVIRLRSSDGDKDTAFVVPTSSTGITSSVASVNELITGEYLITGGFNGYHDRPDTDITNVNASNGGFKSGGVTGWTDTTSIQSGVNGALLVPTDKYLIYGGFWGLNNDTNQRRISKITTGGAFDGGFTTSGTSFNNVIYDAILTSGGTYLVVGSFDNYNGVIYNRICVLNTDGSVNGGETAVFGSGFNSPIYSITLTSTNQYLVAGLFSSYNGTSTNGMVLLNLDGSVDPTFNIGNGFVGGVQSAIETSDGNYLVGGSFTTYNGSPRNRVLKIQKTGIIDSSFDIGTGIQGTVNVQVTTVIETSDGYYLVGGIFETYDGVTNNNFVKLHSNGTAIW